ncbi:MAG: hypothetical protein QOG48_1475 [Verrucomicrobiota bacterium]|jgi:hypothetical protein
MKYILTGLFAMILPIFSADGGPRSSANYSIPTDSTDAAGSHVQSANYSVNGSAAGEFGAGSNAIATSVAYAGKNGFVGQLYDLVALSVTAPPSANLNETANRQLLAAPLADDATTLAAFDPSTVGWSIVSGPIASISTGGLATAGTVYQDTPATIGGSAQSLSGQLNLTILNVTNDDFGAYANDQIDDSWQVQYFGQPPNSLAGPNVDADGTGQTNLFKFVAGLNPLDGSRFTLSILQVSGQPSQKQLVFQPIVSGRTYTPQFATGLTTPNWSALTGTTQIDNGNQRTVTDPNATPAPKYYRLQISKP